MGRTTKDMKSKIKIAIGALLSAWIITALAPVCGAKPGDNIMLGAKLHESTGYINDEERDIFLFDGDYDTKWCATIDDVKYDSKTLKNLASDGFIHILSVDFGEEKYFDSYRLYLASTGARDFGVVAYNACAWKIQISSDGEIWKDVSRVTECYEEEVVTVNLGVRKARYLRILVDQPEQTAGTTLRLYELEVYECEPGELAGGIVRTNGSNIELKKSDDTGSDADIAEAAAESEDIELGYVPSEAVEYKGYELGAGGVVAMVALAIVAIAIAAIASRRAAKEQLY